MFWHRLDPRPQQMTAYTLPVHYKLAFFDKSALIKNILLIPFEKFSRF